MTDFLDQVVAERRADAEASKRERTEAAVLEEGLLRGRTTGSVSGIRDAFTHALRSKQMAGQLAVIAEVKRVSPALGTLRSDVDVRRLARAYEKAGAAAISVLCEPRHWGGSLQDLEAVRSVVGIPVLCKDVIVDERQLVEAWAAGAHAVLLIAEALDDGALRRLAARAQELGLGTLVEAHETAAFERAVRSGSPVVGVNARDLRAPKEIRPERIGALHGLAGEQQILVAESGIASAEDARGLPARVDAILVGTALMRAEDPTVLLRQLAAVQVAPRVYA